MSLLFNKLQILRVITSYIAKSKAPDGQGHLLNQLINHI